MIVLKACNICMGESSKLSASDLGLLCLSKPFCRSKLYNIYGLKIYNIDHVYFLYRPIAVNICNINSCFFFLSISHATFGIKSKTYPENKSHQSN